MEQVRASATAVVSWSGWQVCCACLLASWATFLALVRPLVDVCEALGRQVAARLHPVRIKSLNDAPISFVCLFASFVGALVALMAFFVLCGVGLNTLPSSAGDMFGEGTDESGSRALRGCLWLCLLLLVPLVPLALVGLGGVSFSYGYWIRKAALFTFLLALLFFFIPLIGLCLCLLSIVTLFGCSSTDSHSYHSIHSDNLPYNV